MTNPPQGLEETTQGGPQRPVVPPQRVQIRCQNCQTPFVVALWTYVDVGVQPELKGAMLSGQLNVAVCPSCGAGGMLASPLIYHDPEKKFFWTLFPQELNLPTEEQERFVGEASKVAMQLLPPDAPRGYLLTPRRFITMQTMLETLLESEGITKEVMQAQRQRVELLSQLAEALEADRAENLLDSDQGKLAQVVAANKAALDGEFFLTLNSYIEAALQQGREDSAEMIGELSQRVMQLSGFDPVAAGLQEPAVEDVVAALRDADDASLEDVISNYRPLIDDETFEAWDAQIAELPVADQAAAQARRDHIYTTLERMDAEAQAIFEKANGLLRDALQAEDPRALLVERHKELSEAFFVVIDANLNAAMRTNQQIIAEQLMLLRQTAAEVLQEAMTPQERLINQLLSAETAGDATKLLRKNMALVNGDFVKEVNELVEQMEKAGRKEVVERLRQVARESASLLF